MLETVSAVVLGIACGFGIAVWAIVAGWHWRRDQRWLGFWYVVLAVTYLACTVLIVGRALGRFQVLPRGATLVLLAPILAVPPGIQFVAWLQARRMLVRGE